MKYFKPDQEGYITIISEKELKIIIQLMFLSGILLLLYLTGYYQKVNFLSELNILRKILTLLGRCDIIDC